MSSLEVPDVAPELAVDDVTVQAAQQSPLGSFYQHVASEQVTQFVPPGSSVTVWQVTGLEPNSGVVFLSLINDKAFHGPDYVRTHMQRIGHVIYDESLVAGVAGISVQQITDAQHRLVNQLEVTVESSSGNSAGTIISPYPNPADRAGSVAAFSKLVAAEVALLDKNEAS